MIRQATLVRNCENILNWTTDNVRFKWFSVITVAALSLKVTQAYFVSPIDAKELFLMTILILILFLNNPRSSITVLGVAFIVIIAGLFDVGYSLAYIGPAIDHAANVLTSPTNDTSPISGITETTPTLITDVEFLRMLIRRTLPPDIFNLADTLLIGLTKPKMSTILMNIGRVDELRISLNALIHVVVIFLVILSAIVILILACGCRGRYQDYRRKRQKYYKHVQGLLLVRSIDQSEGTLFATRETDDNDDKYEIMNEDPWEESTKTNIDQDYETDTEDISTDTDEEIFSTEKIEVIPSYRGKIKAIFKNLHELLRIKFKKLVQRTRKKIIISIRNWRYNVPNKNRYRVFFYPQRLLIGLTSGLIVAFLVILVILFYLGIWVLPFIQSLLDIVANVCVIPAFGREYFCYLDPDTINLIKSIITPVVSTILIISPIMTFLLLVYDYISMLLEYKKNILRMRKGRYPFNRDRFNLTNVYNYIGTQTAYTLMSAVFTTLFISLVLLILVAVITVAVICYYFDNATFVRVTNFLLSKGIPLVLAFVIYRLIYVLFRWIFFSRKALWTRYYYLSSYFELIFIVYNLFVNVYLAFFIRLLLPVFLYFINFARLDRTTNSHSVDGGYSIYISLLLTDHRHNNPLLSVFIDTLKRFLRFYRASSCVTENANVYPDDYSRTTITLQEPNSTIETVSHEQRSQNVRRLVKLMSIMYTLDRNDRLKDKRKYRDNNNDEIVL